MLCIHDLPVAVNSCLYNTAASVKLAAISLYIMFHKIILCLLIEQAAKFAAIRLNVLSRWNIAPSGYPYILKVDPVAPVNTDYIPAEYCLDRHSQFLIACRDE